MVHESCGLAQEVAQELVLRVLLQATEALYNLWTEFVLKYSATVPPRVVVVSESDVPQLGNDFLLIHQPRSR